MKSPKSKAFRPVTLLAGACWMACACGALAAVQVDFSHSYTGAASAIQNTGNITLSFAVDASGNVSLDASCTDPDPASYVNEFDGPVGTVSDPAMWGQGFSIVLSSTGSGALRINNTGGGLALQGGNAQLIDADASGVNEVITATLSAPGTRFSLQGIGYVGVSGGANLNLSGTVHILSGSSGTADVSSQGVNGTFTVASSASAVGQGFVLSGLSFDMVAAPPAPGTRAFDNGSGNRLWTTASNWNPDGVPASANDAEIAGFDVILNGAAGGISELRIINGSLTLSGSGALSMKSMTIGRNIEKAVRLVMAGSGVSFGYSGASSTDEFAVGTAATVETKPDSGGCEPLELGSAKLVLDRGSQWILDGTDFTGSFNVGNRFVLANFGSFSGSTAGVRTRNFDLPANRRLQLTQTATSLYYEVVAQTAATGPNIIIVNVDDMAGGQHFGFEGRDCITPTLDTLASTGVRFTQAFAASTVCGPSRYSLLTGRWASRNTSAQFIARYPLGTLGRFGVSDTELETDGENLGAWLRQAGYRTGMVGKGHFTDDDLNSTANWAAKGLLTYPQAADPKTDAATNGKMKHNHRVLCQRMREFGFDYVESYYKANLAELRNDALNVHNQEWITKGALDFIEENHGERFFLYMAPTINHGPVRNDLSKTLLADKGYTSAGYLPDEDYTFMPARQAIVNQVTGAGKDLISARETWLDYSIKAILNKLTQHGIRNDTLIIFTSDHGEKTLNGPLVWGKSSLYDLGMKVPFVMNWPNGVASPGRNYGEIISHVDIAPTLLALTGASALPTRPVDGVSLVPVLNGGNAAVRDDLFCEIGYARAVRTRDRKYIAVRYTPSVYTQIANGGTWPQFGANSQPTGGTIPRPYYINNSGLGAGVANTNPTYFDDDQLYNLNTDPDENTNLYGQEPATTYDLKKRLANYIGGIPDRPFRQFSGSSTEFSPAPTAAPQPPGNLQTQLLSPNSVKLDWTDASDNELGYIVRKHVNGGPGEIVAELPAGATTATVPVDAGVEDIVLKVAGYNAMNDAQAANPVDLLSPDAWRFRIFGDVDPGLSTSFSQWGNDADGDGVPTLWEYAFATNPRLASSVARPEGRLTRVGEDSFLEYWLPRDRRRAVQIAGSVSIDLSIWNTGLPHCIVASDEQDHLLLRSSTPVGDESKQFMRAEIIEP
ncbi:sulfatase-like hydrolase/transferase [Akkermansiaceae bacterium]|nr:sulfatase-like hydrolase/transferase [Akkermansiaceae bacterium]